MSPHLNDRIGLVEGIFINTPSSARPQVDPLRRLSSSWQVRRLACGGEDPNHGNWWLEFGSGELVGYWPSLLFSHLADHAGMVQFGGEIVNTEPSGFHTSTEMGSGHLARGGFGRSSYFRNLQLVDWDNSLVPAAGIRLLADNPACYDIVGGVNRVWGNYFYYGGPGRSMTCP
ncbi:hypothetical protein KSP39_PZI015601 [Platanthera zijinensis]|uniref:Neprosin PEP catalytic domain-containing protein n=1 Tax=Platanthera zijinensis TaxID=2320716 RepID=A0AAP0G1M2_9ASPA